MKKERTGIKAIEDVREALHVCGFQPELERRGKHKHPTPVAQLVDDALDGKPLDII